jgi:UDP-glucuronate 4-epimerase
LLSRGDDVVAIDSFDDFYDSAVKRRNISGVLSRPRFRLVEGDIRDFNAVDEALQCRPDAIVHLAARAGVRPSMAQPMLYQDVNVRGTLTLLEAVRTLRGVRFVFASSSSVYGNAAKVPFSEDDRVDEPISPYAATKRSGELLCYTYHHLFGMPVTCLRFFTVYGPRQRPDLAIHQFVRLIEDGGPLTVFGDGSMSRDFTYVDDIIDGVVRAVDRCAGFRIYNLGESQPVSVQELVRLIEEATGKRATVNYAPPQPGDVDRTYADVTRACRELDYRPSTDICTGLRRFVDWFRSERLMISAEQHTGILTSRKAESAVIGPNQLCTSPISTNISPPRMGPRGRDLLK